MRFGCKTAKHLTSPPYLAALSTASQAGDILDTRFAGNASDDVPCSSNPSKVDWPSVTRGVVTQHADRRHTRHSGRQSSHTPFPVPP